MLLDRQVEENQQVITSVVPANGTQPVGHEARATKGGHEFGPAAANDQRPGQLLAAGDERQAERQ